MTPTEEEPLPSTLLPLNGEATSGDWNDRVLCEVRATGLEQGEIVL